MKKFKKIIMTLSVVFVSLIVISITTNIDEIIVTKTVLYLAAAFNLNQRDYFVSDFKEHQSDFERIANLITDYGKSYDSADESDSRFIYFTPDRYSSSGSIIFKVKKDSSSTSSEIYFSAEETEVFKRITGCFKVEEAGFHSFSFDKKEKMVYFHTSHSRYSLVYSAENKKPYYVDSIYESEDKQEYVVEKICKNWFNIAKA